MPRALLALLLISPVAAFAERVERRVYAMGTELSIAVEAADRSAAIAASESALKVIRTVEDRLSTWQEASELALLNRTAVDRPFRLSERLAADLETARRCWEETSGAFDPTVGALVDAWALRAGGRRPSVGELDQALAATGMERLEMSGRAVVRRHEGLVLEEGGFGKGVGLDEAVAALARDPRVAWAEMDFGGQIATLGSQASWGLTLADPRDRSRPVIGLSLEGARISVATSGTSERGGHLLDPSTGRPAADFGSLTVWTESAARADCLSTGLYVLGPEKALAWAERHEGVEVLVLEAGPGRELTARATTGLDGRIRALDENVTIVETDLIRKGNSIQSP